MFFIINHVLRESGGRGSRIGTATRTGPDAQEERVSRTSAPLRTRSSQWGHTRGSSTPSGVKTRAYCRVTNDPQCWQAGIVDLPTPAAFLAVPVSLVRPCAVLFGVDVPVGRFRKNVFRLRIGCVSCPAPRFAAGTVGVACHVRSLARGRATEASRSSIVK